MTHFHKYHGLGNDYLVVRPEEIGAFELPPERIREICDRHTGLGSDGILLGPLWPGRPGYPVWGRSDCLAAMRIYNPDGSEAEKSGNGLRIFTQFMADQKEVAVGQQFALSTWGGRALCSVLENYSRIRVEMGRVEFIAVDSPLEVGGKLFRVCEASIGNPHCIIPVTESDGGLSEMLARTYGPLIEQYPRFPNRTNVQFLKKIDDHSIAIEIWERGAGYTLASGSSACCCAAAAVRLGLCSSPVAVNMPGGILHTEIDQNYQLIQTGPVAFVFSADTNL